MSLPKTPSDPNVEWHVLLRGERRGPYTPAGLRDLLETHPDGWSASVWRPGMLDWRPAEQVEALRQAAQLTPADCEPRQNPPPTLPSLPKLRAEAAFILTPSEDEVALRAAQTRTRAAPLFAQTTHEMPTYGRPRRSERTLYYLLAIGSLALLSALLLFSKWRSTSASTRVPPPEAVATQPVARRPLEPSAPLPTTPPPIPAAAPLAPSAPPLPLVPAAPPAPAAMPAAHATASQVEVREQNSERPFSARADEGALRHAGITRVRVRARWAPVRSAADPNAKVLCSVPRGTLLAVSGERPGTHARWFAVHCDAQTGGWMHENFLASVR